MTFEPLIHHTFLTAFLIPLGWSVLASLVVIGLIYLSARRRGIDPSAFMDSNDSTEGKAALIAVAGMTLLATMLSIGMISGMTSKQHNMDAVFNNVSKKYDVDALEFQESSRSLRPEQSEAQEVNVTSNGKTRPVFLIQDALSSEPTLLDYDSGEPVEDLLRK